MRKSFGKFYKGINNRVGSGLIVLVMTIGVFQLFKAFPQLYELLYLNSTFQVIRVIHDLTLGFLPIPSIYIALLLFLVYFFNGHLKSIKGFFGALLAFVIWIINFFYFSWGFNYAQPSLYETMNLTPVAIDSVYIKKTFYKVYDQLQDLSEKDHTEIPTVKLENSLRETQEDLLEEMNIPIVGRVRIRALPSGSLLHLRTSGIYIPHAIEGHIDKGLFYKQHPFTMAHEMAHGYSFTDESVCNFLGYLTCMRAENDLIKYSGTMAYWRYLAKYFRYFFPEEYKSFYESMNPIIRSDLKSIRDHIERYKDLMPRGRDIIYDSYLKSHGVKAGIKSYDQMIELIAAYEAKVN